MTEAQLRRVFHQTSAEDTYLAVEINGDLFELDVAYPGPSATQMFDYDDRRMQSRLILKPGASIENAGTHPSMSREEPLNIKVTLQ